MLKPSKPTLIVFLIFNSIVLLGQLWPEGAPPFARVVNIITLAADLLFFVGMMRGNQKGD